MSSNIQAIYNLRSQKSTATIVGSTRSKIEEIRTQVKAGVDGDGWQRVIHGWRAQETPKPAINATTGNRFKEIQSPSMRKSDSNNSLPQMTRGLPKTVVQHNAIEKPAPQPYKRYESKFKNSDQDVESTIVNTIILGKLNKFSAQNYSDVYEFLSEILASGECDFLSDFMKLIFTKAATEETFCPLYAKLLKELSAKYPFLLSEMDILYNKFLNIFEELEDDDNECAIQRRKEKKYRQGYSQFLAELLKQDVVDTNAFYNTIDQIIKQIDIQSKLGDKTNTIEEYGDCLIKLLKVLKPPTRGGQSNSPLVSDMHSSALPTNETMSDKMVTLRTNLSTNLKSKMDELTRKSADRPSLNNKIRFTMMDAIDAIN
jgi:hypothetical protein